MSILDHDDTGLGVDFEETLSGTRVLVDLSDGEELDDEQLSSLNLDVHLFVDDGLAQKVTSRNDTQIPVLFEESLELLKDLVESAKNAISWAVL